MYFTMEGAGLVSLTIPRYHFNTVFCENVPDFFPRCAHISVRPYIVIVKFRSAQSFQR